MSKKRHCQYGGIWCVDKPWRNTPFCYYHYFQLIDGIAHVDSDSETSCDHTYRSDTITTDGETSYDYTNQSDTTTTDGEKLSSITPEVRSSVEQDGGKIAALAKLGSTLAKSSGKISKGLSKVGRLTEKGLAKAERAQTLLDSGLSTAEELTSRAESLAEQTSGIASQVSDIYRTYGPRGSDLNYSHPSLSASGPLAPSSSGNFQSFGDYICINKAFVRDMRTLYNELFARRNDV